MAHITDTPAALTRLTAWIARIIASAPRVEPTPIDGAKAHAANMRREAARRAVDNLLR